MSEEVFPANHHVEIIFLALQSFQVPFLWLRDWIPLGRLNDVAAIRSQDTTLRLYRCDSYPKILGIEAQVGIGMKDLGYGEPLLRDTFEELPRSPAPLAATPNNTQLVLAYLEPKAPEAGEIPGYSVPFSIGLLFSILHLGRPYPHWLHMWLWISYSLISVGQLCAHRFLPTRNGLVPNTAHIMLHIATAATLFTLLVN